MVLCSRAWPQPRPTHQCAHNDDALLLVTKLQPGVQMVAYATPARRHEARRESTAAAAVAGVQALGPAQPPGAVVHRGGAGGAALGLLLRDGASGCCVVFGCVKGEAEVQLTCGDDLGAKH